MACIKQKPDPNVPPTIDDVVADQSVMLGEPWELKIHIGGDGPIEFKVEKDNVQLTETDNIKISYCNGIVTLTIADVKEEDLGEYKLDVTNECGKANCTFNIYSFSALEIYEKVIVKTRSQLLEDLDPIVTLDAFIETEYISKVLARDISELPTTSDRIRKILDIATKKGQKGYNDFKDCLRKSKQEDLVELLENAEIAIKNGRDVPKARTKTVLNSDQRVIQTDLIQHYKQRCKTLPVSPMFDNKDENILEIYKPPTMCSIEGTKEKKEYKPPTMCSTEEKKEIRRFEQIFCKDSKPCNQIYITGDAGMGKTSFCTFMCKLWCVGKLGDKLDDKHKELQKDVEYMSKFDFVFYISLRDSEHFDVIDMIKEHYLRHIDPLLIQDILRKQCCLILMDGLDEWQPQQDGKNKYKLPKRFYSDKCVYITTCRPYRIESVRLSRRDVDHYIQTTGIHGDASESYVRDVIQYMNKENSTNMEVSDFMKDIHKCGLHDQLCIPMVASHLVVLWFEKTLTDMPRALIYANILEMLFRRAKKREVEFPPPTASTLQLPDSLSGLEYLNKHVSLLYNVCHLSFRSLFKQDEDVTNLVFTRQQLQAKPYCFSIEETDFLCKIGILSKNEVFGCYSVERLKVSFIHKSYVEFFASLYTSSFDRDNVHSDATQSWKTLDDVLQYKNFFLLLAGFSYSNVKSSMENVYLKVSEDLITCRRNSIFHYDYSLRYSSKRQIEQLQDIVINCYKEVRRSNVTNIVLKLEDFIFNDKSDVDIMKQLLLLNTTCVKSVFYYGQGKYYDAFDEIKNLHCLHVDYVLSEDYVKFTKCMLNNQSTLHTVCIEGSDIWPRPLLPVFPVRDLHQLTSLSLSRVTIHNLCDLVNFLSDNVHFEHIELYHVFCDKHPLKYSDCTLTLNLHNHTQLTVLDLSYVNILCKNVNNSSLKSVTLLPPSCSERIVGGYIDIFNCFKSSQLEHLFISGRYIRLDDETMRTLTAAVKTLQCIKSLTLWKLVLVGGLELHPGVTPVKIELYHVTMCRQCFHCFIKSCVNTKSVIKVELNFCNITTVDGESHRELSERAQKETVKYMFEYLTPIQTVTITEKGDYWLYFETSCQ